MAGTIVLPGKTLCTLAHIRPNVLLYFLYQTMKPVKNHPTPRPHRQLVRDDALAGDLRAIAQPNPDELAPSGC